jgi:hypothetical protein
MKDKAGETATIALAGGGPATLVEGLLSPVVEDGRLFSSVTSIPR